MVCYDMSVGIWMDGLIILLFGFLLRVSVP